MLNENAVFIPVNDLSRELVTLKEPDELSESNVCCAQQYLSVLTFHHIVQTGPDVKINSGEIDLTKISSVVHMCKYHVNIASCANS